MCNFFSYVNNNGQLITGRTMDAMNAACVDRLTIRTMPAGIEHTSNTSNPLTWTSKYNSVAEYSKTFCSDGMNEKGLVVSLLYFAAANHGLPNGRKTIPVSAVTQYLLDNFANVDEAVEFFRKDEVCIMSSLKTTMIEDMPFGCHWAMVDKDGRNAVVEFIDGKPFIWRQDGKRMAMTNDPSYDRHLGLLNYLDNKGLTLTVSGTGDAEARFLRMHGWMNELHHEPYEVSMSELPEENSTWQLRVMAKSITRAMTTPYHVDFGGRHQNSASLWTVNCDPQNLWMCIEHLKSFSLMTLDFNKLDFSKGIQEIRCYEGKMICGNIEKEFGPLKEPFMFSQATDAKWNNYDPADKAEMDRKRVERFGA